MTTTTITVEATLQPDGITLHLENRVPLPPGRVTVTVQPTKAAAGLTMLEVLDRIHQDQQRRGLNPMTEEEIAAEIAQARTEDNDYEGRWREIWSRTNTKGERTDNP